MASATDLRLHEEQLLLALDDRKGTIRSTNYRLAMGAGLLAELLLAGRVRLEPGAKPSKDRILPADPKPLADPLLDECLRKVHDAKKPKPPKAWIATFAQMSGIRKRVATALVRRGLLREQKSRVLLLFPWTFYPALDPAQKRRLVERIRDAVAGDGEVDERTAIAVAAAAATGGLKPSLGKPLLKQRKQRIEQIAESVRIAAAVKQAADEAAAAAAIAASG